MVKTLSKIVLVVLLIASVTSLISSSPATAVVTPPVVSNGGYFNCAILPNGSVRCWGENSDGQLGVGNTADIGDNELAGTGATVNLGSGRTAVQVVTGNYHACAILDNGSVRCWGANNNGQLGYGNTTTIGDNETPGSVGPVDLGGGRTATRLAAGAIHTCAVLDNGSVLCWGNGSFGRLGYGNGNTIGDNETPASAGAVSLGGTASSITAGGANTCALMTNSTVRCWGEGGNGRNGNNSTAIIGDNELPSSISAITLGTTATAISGGDSHTCAILTGGAVQCWGLGSYGRLGYGNSNDIGDNETPASAGSVSLGSGRTATAIAAGSYHTCAILDDGSVICWGAADFGALGYGNAVTIGDNETPASVGPVNLGGNTATRISARDYSTCVTLNDNNIRCWGTNNSGVLGIGVSASAGIGDNESILSIAPVPISVPDAPTIDTLTPTDDEVTVAFDAPEFPGGLITSYVIEVSPGSITASGSSSPITVTGLTGSTSYTVVARAVNAIGTSADSAPELVTTDVPVVPPTTTPPASSVAPGTSKGYTIDSGKPVAVDGYANVPNPIQGVAVTPSGHGTWTVASDGGVFTTGDAGFFGSTGGQKLNAPVVGISATSDGGGYVLGASDGGVFSFGNAPYEGSLTNVPLNAPASGIALTCTTDGYYMVARDGGVFAFGDAVFYGSMVGKHLNAPIVAIVPTCNGYYLVGEDGGVFAFGSAVFFGSAVGQNLGGYDALIPTSSGEGYWLINRSGTIVRFGDAT